MSETHADISFDEAFEQALSDMSGVETPKDTSTDAAVDKDTSTEGTEQVKTENIKESKESSQELDTTKSSSEDDTASGTEEVESLEDLKAQLARSEQKFKSYEGRMRAEFERRKQEEFENQRRFVELIAQRNSEGQNKKVEEELPPQLKELYETFPDIAQGVEALVKQRLSSTNKFIEEEIKKHISPLVTDLYATKTDTHVGRILSKHPDALTLRESGKLDVWINSLPRHSQLGANYVLNNGTAEEVISLLDQYKEFNKKPVTEIKNKNEENNEPTKEKKSDQLVDKVIAGLVVKSGKSADPKTDTNKKNVDDFDAAWEDAIKALGAK